MLGSLDVSDDIVEGEGLIRSAIVVGGEVEQALESRVLEEGVCRLERGLGVVCQGVIDDDVGRKGSPHVLGTTVVCHVDRDVQRGGCSLEERVFAPGGRSGSCIDAESVGVEKSMDGTDESGESGREGGDPGGAGGRV